MSKFREAALIIRKPELVNYRLFWDYFNGIGTCLERVNAESGIPEETWLKFYEETAKRMEADGVQGKEIMSRYAAWLAGNPVQLAPYVGEEGLIVKLREKLGSTVDAKPGTLRGDLCRNVLIKFRGMDIRITGAHVSDSIEAAAREIRTLSGYFHGNTLDIIVDIARTRDIRF